MRLTSTDTLSVVALAKETVDTADWECETSLGRTPVRDDVSLRQMEKRMQNALFWIGKARQRRWMRQIHLKRWANSEDLRLSAGFGTAGLASGLAASHFDGCEWFG